MRIARFPLIAFLVALLSPIEVERPFAWSVATTAAAFLAVGAIKSRFVDQRWYWSALETLGVGGSAAVLAYIIGWALRDLVS